MAIRANQVDVFYGRKKVLDNVSFDCQPGEFVALCGPNGAGKSTLLKAVAGDIGVDNGDIRINGSSVCDLTQGQQALMRAVMPQQVDVAFNVQASSVIEMGLLFTEDERERTAIVELVSGLLRLDTLLDRSYPSLSGGEKQRIQLARVIAQLLQSHCDNDKYLLLDECSSAMDMAMVHLAFSVVRQLVDDGHFGNIGVVAVVHDINIASLYADRIVMLHDQRICANGSPRQVVTAQHIERVFNTPVSVMDHPEHACPVVIQG
ncbi:Hemin import ATP-binding protein HmuV [BD1-7 clade bacterium]|uniref:Hemin import ATP-binding protein HmuV n=1 Tax=BD1-7 clade bacterium TaxID=2029982 RepID=A0A5S9MXG5_9GAMM|nr:Hemin import ATP-binding protein HmuV [BD1-7 clade bacterium]CAA0082953.1 Hemin import ATP-binding protein HmuV [BD1-7 clade bacterium]